MSRLSSDYVANLFSRRRPAGLDANTSAAALMNAFASAPSEGLEKNVETVRATLAMHGYALTTEDLSRIAHVQGVFNRGGMSITAEFESPGSQASLGGAIPVTFTQLMTATDKNGQPWSFLSSEAAYQYVRELHRKNLIIPLVGDFAGPSVIRKVGDYVRQRNSNVAAFYVSNVEYYLNGPTMRVFQASLASLPIDSSTMLIRWSPRSTAQNLPWATPTMGVATMLQPASKDETFKAHSRSTIASSVVSHLRCYVRMSSGWPFFGADGGNKEGGGGHAGSSRQSSAMAEFLVKPVERH